MKNLIILISLFFSSITISCNFENNEFNNIKTLKKDKNILFPLDSLTDYFLPTISLFTDTLNNKTYFCYLNEDINTLYFHDYNTKKLAKKIHFEKTGPNSVGILKSYLIVNYDTIVLTNGQRQVIISDTSSTVKFKTFTMDFEKIQTARIPDVILTSTNIPIIYHNSNIFISGVLLGLSNDYKPVLKINTQDSTIKQVFKYPNIKDYSTNGNLLYSYYRYYSTYNSQKNLFVYSFPISDSLHITNYKNIDTVVYAGSNHVKTINSSNKDNTFDNFNFIDATRNSYYSILYDKYRNVYYRFVRLAIDKDVAHQSAAKDLSRRKLAIVILDKNFNKIGDVLINSRDYNPFTAYINESDGLCILNVSECMNNEDELIFTSFKLKDINKNEK